MWSVRVATELASNACDHADDPRRLVLRREVHPDRGPELVVEAPDATPDRSPVVGASSVSPTRGNGMKMVESICSDRGVRHEGDLKLVSQTGDTRRGPLLSTVRLRELRHAVEDQANMERNAAGTADRLLTIIEDGFTLG